LGGRRGRGGSYVLFFTTRRIAKMNEKSNHYYENIFKMSLDLFMISTLEDAIYVSINDGFTRLLGYSEEEVIHKSAIDLGIWVDIKDRQKVLEQIKNKGVIQNLESKFRAKNGTIIPVLVSANIIDIDGIPHFLGTARDMTEQKITEKVLKESEERFRELSELSPVGIYLTDNHGSCLYVNKCWRIMSGLSIEEALGEGWINGLHPEDRLMVLENWNKMVTEEGKWGLEYRFQNKEGKVMWVYGVASPRRDLKNEIIGYVGVNVDITDRKETQLALKESQLLLKSSLESQKDTILFSIDKNYHYLYFNKAHHDVMKFAYNIDIEVGMNILVCVTEKEDQIVAKENYDKALRGESHSNIRIFGDINKAYYESFFNPIYNENNEIIGATGLARDITERISAQEKETENHQRLNLAMQVANMAWWEMDIQTGKVTFDKRKVEMLGYAPDKFLTYHDFMALVHPDDYENTMNAMRKHLVGRIDKYEVDYRIKASTGEYLWFHDIGSIVKRDYRGKPLLVTGLVIDISMNKAAEVSLNESEKRFHDLFSSMMEGFAYHQILLDEQNQPIDYIFLEMNHSFEKLTGLNREKSIGKKVTEVIAGIEKDSTDWIGIYGKVAMSGKSVSFESYSASLNQWYMVSAYSPKVGYFATLFQDFTERKQTEEEINNLNETLELKVQQRTAELENTMEAMRSFSYSISHDLRAPLRAIDGFSSILASKLEPIFDEEDKRLFSIIRDNVKKMNLLILDLLELAKVSNLDIKHFPINMEEMIHSVYWEMVSEDDKLRIQFKLVNIIDCLGDPLLIKQVWVNLIENAVKFSRKKDNPVITITSSKDKYQITYSIQDNGAGFNPEYKKKLFIAFSRLHADEEYKGTGIGLVLVQRIIHRHGGKVWAEGEEGVGATFYFSLPNEMK
jgi:PAS domain S-box-containing protein